MTAQRQTLGGRVWLDHGKKARLIGWADLSTRERTGPSGQSQREREGWVRDWAGAERAAETKRRERSGRALGLRPRSADLATGPREGWRESACGREGVVLGLCDSAGWATRPKIERGKFSSFFSFPNLFQILISKSISTNFEFLFEAKQVILINQMQ